MSGTPEAISMAPSPPLNGVPNTIELLITYQHSILRLFATMRFIFATLLAIIGTALAANAPATV